VDVLSGKAALRKRPAGTFRLLGQRDPEEADSAAWMISAE
jgi:hypothetical protein